MASRRTMFCRVLVGAALAVSFAVGLSAIVSIAAAPCLEPTPGKGPRCRDVFCGPCEELACGGRGRCDFICAPIPGCVP